MELLAISGAPPLDLVVLAPVEAASVDLEVLVQRRVVLPVEEGEAIFLLGQIFELKLSADIYS